MKPAVPLTDLKMRKAKPKDRPYRLFDGDGLALLVQPTGVKSWQLRYRLNGKPQTWTMGKLDRLTLADARGRAAKARKAAAAGEHLTAVKHMEKAKKRADARSTFSAVAAEWIKSEAKEQKWSADYKDEVEASLKNHLGELDSVPLVKITAALVAPLMRDVKRKAPNMLPKVRSRLRAILDTAVEDGLIPGNPLPAVRRRKGIEKPHYPAVVDLPGLGEILRAANKADPCKGIARAHALLVYTAQRVGEIVGAAWDEVDLKAGVWSIPRSRMKRKDEARGPHQVPLPPTLLAAMHEWKKADGPDAVYVCVAPRDPKASITRESVEKFYRRTLGQARRHGPHSWRSAFSTVCREAGKDGDVIEAQLDHVVGNAVAASYDRAKRLELRRSLLTWYESTLLAALDGASVSLLTDHQRRKR